MGRVGYLYESVKDQLKWHELSVKQYVRIISQVGQIMSMSDEDFESNRTDGRKVSDLKGKELESYLFSVM